MVNVLQRYSSFGLSTSLMNNNSVWSQRLDKLQMFKTNVVDSMSAILSVFSSSEQPNVLGQR